MLHSAHLWQKQPRPHSPPLCINGDGPHQRLQGKIFYFCFNQLDATLLFMKKLIFLLVLILSTACAGNGRYAIGDPNPSPFASTSWSKLDLRLQTAWLEAMGRGEKARLFELIIKTAAPLTAAEKTKLRKAGYAARTFAGAIVTGSAKARDIEQIAQLPFVFVMELAVPLMLK